ncbi:hypothetical protein AAKU52_003138 [Pedobacter sp. CG_S7]|uniref:conjugative transposon protein TraM n=1 Tax=Pedobacter sp. CG_S7 TaxID=3143930 RepID=UPI003393E3E7
METKKTDKRKILLVLPVLIVPFMALAFYAMGGGKGNAIHQQTAQKGINTELPDAAFKKDEPTDKMGFYQQSDRDSSANKNSKGLAGVAERLGFNSSEEDPQTTAINEKLEALNKEISRPEEPARSQTSAAGNTSSSSIKNDVDRLEALMRTMQSGKDEDPEMAQLSGMMDKIISIQNPELIQQRLKTQQSSSPDSLFRAIPATIVDNQKAVQGATIKLQLQDSVRLNGLLIPKGHLLFGVCRITNQRLLLDIKNIRMGTSIIPVDLTVYSLDGMAGIYAPEAMLADAVSGGADDAIRSMQFLSMDQSIGVQAAGAGIDAAKGLFSKKVKKIKVKLEAGSSILLRNNKPEKH